MLAGSYVSILLYSYVTRTLNFLLGSVSMHEIPQGHVPGHVFLQRFIAEDWKPGFLVALWASSSSLMRPWCRLNTGGKSRQKYVTAHWIEPNGVFTLKVSNGARQVCVNPALCVPLWACSQIKEIKRKVLSLSSTWFFCARGTCSQGRPLSCHVLLVAGSV